MDKVRIAIVLFTACLACSEADPLSGAWSDTPASRDSGQEEATRIPGARPDGSADETPDSSTFQRFIENHREVPPTFVAFHAQLGSKMTLPASSGRVQLSHFTGLKPGVFARGGPTFETFSGSFSAPWTGIYSFTALVNFDQPLNPQTHSSPSYVSLSICIQGDCENKAALQTGTTVGNCSFGVIATGTLEIRQQQKVSVFLENFGDVALTMDHTTSFMGHSVHA